jgi:SAM-dependent methyltransferase
MNVTEELNEIKARVAARLSRTVPEIPELALPPLAPLRQARAVAEGWAGAFGLANPRPPGAINSLLQAGKRILGRALRWFAFPQTQFNSAAIAAMIRTEDMFADVNRNMVVLGQNLVDRQRKDAELAARLDAAQMLYEVLGRQIERLDERAATLEKLLAEMSRSVNITFDAIRHDIQRVDTSVGEVQKRFWTDLKAFGEDLQEELRLARQRLRTAASAVPAASSAGIVALPTAPALPFDYSHFEQRFRGREDDIRRRHDIYLPLLRDCAPVLDVACGRGEMLELLREQGIEASGVDLDPDMVGRCAEKKLTVVQEDALVYLERLPESSLGAVFSSQFVEHLPSVVYARLIELAFSRLRPGGRLILETQNPECLAIFSQTFYIDPTHVRPVPAAQLRFFMEEAGFRDIRVHYLSPLADARLPQLPGDDEATRRFNATFFGSMDYGITGVKR